MRFLGLALHDPLPDAKTIWLPREQLGQRPMRRRVEHVFAAEKCQMGLVIRCVGPIRTKARIILANLASKETTTLDRRTTCARMRGSKAEIAPKAKQNGPHRPQHPLTPPPHATATAARHKTTFPSPQHRGF